MGTLKLELSAHKTLITSALSGKAKFLGSLIRLTGPGRALRTSTVNLVKRIRNPFGTVKLTAPTGHIIRKLKAKALAVRNKKGFWEATHPKIFRALPVKELIIRYRSILSGYLNYYSFADNRPRLRFIYELLKLSLISVLKEKHQIGVRDILKSYGPNITLRIPKKDGTTVSLSFNCPPLGSKKVFLGDFNLIGDPLSVVD